MRRSILVPVGALAFVLGSVLLLRGQAATDMPHGDMKMDCGECHTPERWVPVEKPPTFRHETTGFALVSAHAKASCRSCHRTLVFNRVGTSCADCHKDAHRGEMGFQCDACHTPTTWSNQREMFQVHNRTRFPLFVSHARLDCTACHRNQQPYEYKNTPAECGNCHLSTFLGTTSPNHVQAGFSRRCEDCHNITSPTWLGVTFSHPASFPLQGGHAGLTCARCHGGGVYTGLSTACVSCHQKDYAATTSPSHVAGRFPTTCESCHTITSWRPAKFDHDQTGFPLTGAHGQVDCAQCHPGGRYAGTPTDCYSCHAADYNGTTDPNHRASGLPTTCESCHNTGAWRPANFDHNKTPFPLTGAHARVACAQCHPGGRYAGTPMDCYSCHKADYDRTTDPNHKASGFPTACQQCHNTNSWSGADFNHAATGFALTGAHASVSCAQCHPGGRYAGTPTDCYSCHKADYDRTTDPNHKASGFPTACQQCHNTNSWKGADFNHAATGFALTGAHASVSCAQCHPGGRYAGTPTDCYSCHQADYNGTTNPGHQAAGFPTQCQSCHTTSAWRPASFDHDGRYFPIYSGRHRGQWSSCSDCHVNPSNYKAFECITCHAHSNKADVDSKHRGVANYSYTSAACYRCHPAGVAGNTRGFQRLRRGGRP